MGFSVIVVAIAALSAPCKAVSIESRSRAAVEVNPIRKVVTLLQNMQIKVTAEGEKEKELFDKFMCYCKTSGETLAKKHCRIHNQN